MRFTYKLHSASYQIIALIFLSLFSISMVVAANDPGHDTLYVEQEGNSTLNGTLNITADLRVAQRIFSDYLDVRGDGTFSGSTNRIIGTSTDLYFESSGDIIFNDQIGTTNMMRVGFTGDTVDLNVTGDAYVLGTTLTVNGVAVCLADGTNCQAVSGSSVAGGWTNTSFSTNTSLDVNIGGGDFFVNSTSGRVGVGTVIPASNFNIYQNSPTANQVLFTVSTSADASRFAIDEDGDVTFDGSLTAVGDFNIQGGDIYDSTANLALRAEDNMYLSIDYNNNDADTTSFIFAKNTGVGVTPTTANSLMTITEAGMVGIGTTLPNNTLSVVGTINTTGNIYEANSRVCTVANGLCTDGTGTDDQTLQEVTSSGTTTTDAITIDSDGDETTIIGGDLNVSGTINSTGNIYESSSRVCTAANGLCAGSDTQTLQEVTDQGTTTTDAITIDSDGDEITIVGGDLNVSGMFNVSGTSYVAGSQVCTVANGLCTDGTGTDDQTLQEVTSSGTTTTDAITIDSDRDGTTIIGGKLNVSKTINSTGRISQNPPATANLYGYMRTNGANQASSTLLNPGILLYGSGTDVFGIDIGTRGPTLNLRFFTTNYDYVWANTSGTSPTAQSHFNELMRLTKLGRLGIRTAYPNSTLHVVGNASISGGLYEAGSRVCTIANGLCSSGGSSNSAGWTNDSIETVTTLNITSNGGNLLLNGTGDATTPTSGTGIRMMWIPGKAALRAGQVTGTEWNTANIGQNSTAFGYNTKANGNGATAIGWTTQASGFGAAAIGTQTNASGDYSIALGREAKARSADTIALGYDATAKATSAIAIGESAFADAIEATAIGFEANASGLGATAIGFITKASGDESLAIGEYLDAQQSQSMIIGTGIDNNNRLNNTKTQSLIIGFNSKTPTLFINQTHVNITGQLYYDNSEVCTTANGLCASGSTSFGWTNTSTLISSAADLNVSVDSGVLFVDATNDVVGIGTSFPNATLDIQGTLRTTGDLSPTVVATVANMGYGSDMTIQGRYLYTQHVTTGYNLTIFDISNPQSPQIISGTPISDGFRAVAVSGKYAYIGGGSLSVVDISNPNAPQIIGTESTPGQVRAIDVVGSYAYLADWSSGRLRVYDITDPTNPVQVSEVTTLGQPQGIDVNGDYVYIPGTSNGDLQIINISNPRAPALLSSISLGASPRSVMVRDGIAVVGLSLGIAVVNITNPFAPTILSNFSSVGYAVYHVSISGEYVTMGGASGLSIVDISDPINPILIYNESSTAKENVILSGRYLYSIASNLEVRDIGGVETMGLEAGSAELGGLNVLGDTYIRGELEASSLTISSTSYLQGDTIIRDKLYVNGTINSTGFIYEDNNRVCTASNGLCAATISANNAAGWSNTSTITHTNLSVGIGTSSPNATLQVSGTSTFTGVVNITGNTTYSIPTSQSSVCFEKFEGTTYNYSRCVNASGHVTERVGIFNLNS